MIGIELELTPKLFITVIIVLFIILVILNQTVLEKKYNLLF